VTLELIDTLLRCTKLSCGRIMLSLELRMLGRQLQPVSLRTQSRAITQSEKP